MDNCKAIQSSEGRSGDLTQFLHDIYENFPKMDMFMAENLHDLYLLFDPKYKGTFESLRDDIIALGVAPTAMRDICRLFDEKGKYTFVGPIGTVQTSLDGVELKLSDEELDLANFLAQNMKCACCFGDVLSGWNESQRAIHGNGWRDNISNGYFVKVGCNVKIEFLRESIKEYLFPNIAANDNQGDQG